MSADCIMRLEWVTTRNCVSLLKAMQQVGEAADVGFVQRRVHFVERAEGAGLELEDGHQQGQRGQGLFAAGEQQHILQLLAGRRGHDVQAALSLILHVREAQEGLTALEEPRKDMGEVLVDAGKSLVEFSARDLIDLLDGLLGVLNRLHQVRALRLQEAVTFGGFLVLVKRHHVHRAHLLDALAQPAAGLLFGGQRLAGQALDERIGAQRGGLEIHFCQAACLQVLEFGASLATSLERLARFSRNWSSAARPPFSCGLHGRQLLAQSLCFGGQRLRLCQRLGAPGCQILLALGQFGALFDALLAFRSGLSPLMVD